MPTSIKVQENFIYGIVPIIIIFLVLAISLIVTLVKHSRAQRGAGAPVAVAAAPPPPPGSVKQKYVSRIKRMEEQIDKGEMSVREGYQQLSAIIRSFVLEYEGIDVTGKTLAELRAFDMPELISLVEEYYVPEFSPETDHFYKSSISRTIRVIELWK